ncbi:odv-e18 [Matsumuraeses phaseoli granulovirus]|uniref:Odv-e18 n=1 Tax=Matsumuraeses phaseoli granulovirus TaxID=2760664 RepID=A0AAE7MLA2_9BBAC|nr:odv-e18 [Matsumuraeses phaseoli granulovirus]QOD39976.1 odv-e18 [Matsumuraeses phaseoli granulovirus]
MDTFRGGAADTGVRRFGLEPNMLMTILVVLVIVILLVLLFNMSSGSDSSGSGTNTTRAGFFNPLNNAMRNNPVVTTATTTRAV